MELKEQNLEEQSELELTVIVHGVAQPQGSKRHVGKGIIVEANDKLRPWRELVTYEIFHELPRDWPAHLAYAVDIRFGFQRPVTHYGTGRNAGILKRNAPNYKVTKPDIDKLVRAMLDSCTDAGMWRDDCQVVSVTASKVYLDNPYTVLKVTARQ